MTGEEMERAIEFLTEHHARVSVKIERVSDDIDKLKAAQEQTTANIERLAEEMHAGFAETREGFAEMHAGFAHTREGFDNLIVANEVTRDLANQVARLAVQTSQRVTALENKSS